MKKSYLEFLMIWGWVFIILIPLVVGFLIVGIATPKSGLYNAGFKIASAGAYAAGIALVFLPPHYFYKWWQKKHQNKKEQNNEKRTE